MVWGGLKDACLDQILASTNTIKLKITIVENGQELLLLLFFYALTTKTEP